YSHRKKSKQGCSNARKNHEGHEHFEQREAGCAPAVTRARAPHPPRSRAAASPRGRGESMNPSPPGRGEGVRENCVRPLSRLHQSRIVTRPVSQSTSTSYLRSPAARVIRPPVDPPSGKKRIAPTLSLTRSRWAVYSLSSRRSGSRCS